MLPRALVLMGVVTAALVAPRRSAAQGGGPTTRIDSTVALATFDSVWRTVGSSLQHRGVTRVDWNSVRDEIRPSVARVRSDGELRSVIDAMLQRLGESHFAVMPGRHVPNGAAAGPTSTLGTAGLTVRYVDNQLLVWRADTAARRAGVEPGAVVESIGEFVPPVLEVRDSVGVRRVTALTAAVRALSGEPGTLVRLVLRDPNGARRHVSFPRDSVRGPLSRFGNLPPLPPAFALRRVVLDDGRCVGVLRFEYWLPPVMPALDRAMDELRTCAGIVLDLRGNLGGVAAMMMGVAGHFMNDSRVLGTMRTRGEEIRFVANPRRATEAGAAVEPFAGPLAIVVDGMSASTSEMFAAAFQSLGRARIIGERTAGQALPAMATRLPNGDVLMHVIADFVAPNGARIEGTGVVPDQVVPLRVTDIRAGRDAPVDAALRWIQQAGRGSADH